jgi:PAS domain S-box-containing protein
MNSQAPSRSSRQAISLRTLLTLPFILLIIAIVSLTGHIFFRDSQRSLDYLAWQLMEEVGDRIEQQLVTCLEIPQQINQINADAVQLGQLDPGNLSQIERHFANQIQQFPEVSAILFGHPDGHLRMIHRNRLADDRLEMGVMNANEPETLSVYTVPETQYVPQNWRDNLEPVATLEAQPLQQRSWYQRAIATGQPGWSEVLAMGPNASLGINAYYPVYPDSVNPTGVGSEARESLRGVFSVNLSLLDLQDFLQSTTLSERGRIFITDHDGLLIATSSAHVRPFIEQPGNDLGHLQRIAPLETGDPLITATTRYMQNHEGERTSQPNGANLTEPDQPPPDAGDRQFQFTWQGASLFVRVRSFPVPTVGNQSTTPLTWQMVEVLPESAFMDGFERRAWQTVSLIGLATLGAIALGSLLASSVTRPIRKLGVAASAIADGDMDQYIPEQLGVRELNRMARSFNWMAQQVRVSFHRIQFAQRVSEEKFTKIFRNSPDPMSISALEDGRFLEVNDSFCQYTGYTYEELVGRTTVEMGMWVRENGLDVENRQRFVEQLLANGKVYDIELPYVSKTGEHKTWLFSTELIELDGQRCVLGLGKDISDRQRQLEERQRIEQELQERERQLSTLISNLPGVAYRARNEPSWPFEFVSAGIQKLTGYPPEAFLGNTSWGFAELIHAEDRDWVWAAVQAALDTHRPFQIAYRIRTAKGTEKWIWEQGQGIFAESGEALALEGFMIDITAQKRAETALLATEARHRAILSAIPDLMVLYSADGRFLESIRTSDTLIDLMDYLPPEVNPAGRPISELLPDSLVTRHMEAIQTAIATGNVQTFENTLELSDPFSDSGDVITQHEEIRVSPINEDMVLVIVRDVGDRKRMEQDLLQQQQFVERITDATSAMLYIYDLVENHNVYVNSRCQEILGYAPDEVQAMGANLFPTIMPQEDLARVAANLEQCHTLSDGEWFTIEYRIRRKTGEWRWLLSRDCVLTRQPDGTPRQILGTAIDITERKALEDELRRQRDFIQQVTDNSPQMLYIFDMEQQRNIYANRQTEQILGYSVEAIQQGSNEFFLEALHPDDIAINQQWLENWANVADGQIVSNEFRIRRADGSWCWLKTREVVYERNADGKPCKLLGTAVDITDQKASEQARQAAEMALAQEQDRLRRAQAIAHMGSWELDLATNQIAWSEETFRIYGLDPSQPPPIYAEHQQQIHPDDYQSWATAMQRLREGLPAEAEFRIFRSDGEVRYIYGQGTPVCNEQGEVIRLFGTIQDISDRKHLEANVREQQELLRTLVETIPDPIYLKDGEGRWYIVNQAGVDAFQLTRADGQNKSDTELAEMFPDYREAFLACAASDEEAWNQGTQSRVEESFVQPDGTRKTFDVRKVPLFDAEGNRQWLVVIGRDISDLKTVEAELRQNNYLIERILHSAPQIIYLYDRQTEESLYVSSQLYTILGYTPDEIQEPGKGFYDTMHPEDRHLFQDYTERLNQLQDGEFIEVEYRQRHADGHWLWLRSRDVVFERDDQGQPSKILGTAIDVTQQKLAEQQLQIQSAALDACANAIVITDRHGTIEWANPAFTNLTGYTPQEAVGKNPRELVKSGFHSVGFYRELWRTILTGGIWHGELVNHRKDGSCYDEEMTITPVRDGQGHIQRFIAVKQNITQRKNLERDLQASQAQLQDILDNASAGIVRLYMFPDQTWQYDYYSPSCEQLYGYTPEELLRDKELWRSRVHPEDFERVIIPTIEGLLSQVASSQIIEYRFHHRDGSWRWISETNTARYDEHGQVWIVTIIAIDITERKQAEQQVQFQAQILDAVQQSVIVSDPEGVITYWNPAAEEIFGWSAAEVLGRSVVGITVSSEQVDRAVEIMTTLQQGRPWSGEFMLKRRDGSSFPALVTDSPIVNDQGELTGIIGISTDISSLKQTELALRESEARNRAILMAMPDMIVLADHNGVRLHIERSSNDVFDLTQGQAPMIGRPLSELSPPDIVQMKLAAISRIIATGEKQSYEQRIWAVDHWRYEEVRAVPCGDDRVLFLIRDITDRKAAEKALQTSEARLRLAMEAAQLVIWELDWQTKQVSGFGQFHNGEWMPENWQGSAEDIRGLIHPEEQQQFARAVENIARFQSEFALEHRLVPMTDASGSPQWLMMRGRAIADSVGNTRRIIGVSLDITRRKQAEQANQSLSERLQFLLSQSPAILYTCDPQGDFPATFISENLSNTLGYTPHEAIQNVNWWVSNIHPEDAPHLFDQIQQLFVHDFLTHEYRFRHQNGTYRWIRDSLRLIRDADGHPVEVVGAFVDISDRKQIELELANANQELRYLMEHTPLALMEWDNEFRVCRWSEQAEHLFGWTESEVIGRSWDEFSLVYEDDVPGVTQVVAQLLGGENEQSIYQNRNNTKDGRVIHCQWYNSVLQDEAGNIVRILSLANDVSDRIYAEQALRESETKFRTIFENSLIGIVLAKAPAFRLDLCNDAFLHILGYSQAELATLQFSDFTHPDDLAREMRLVDECFAGMRDSYQIEKRYIRKDGSMPWVSLTSSVIRDAQGDIISSIAMIQDVSDRKQAEEDLRRSEEQFRQIADNIKDVFFLKSIDGTLLYVNPANELVYQRTIDQAQEQPQSWLECIHPDDRDRVRQHLERQISDQNFSEIEYRIIRPDGEVRWIWDRAFPIRDDQGHIYRYAGINRDITPRKLAELTLRKTLREKEVMLAEIHHRVKNNLQVISSLLDLQALRTPDQDTRLALEDSRSRVNAMAIVHEKLYRSGNFTNINALDYLQDLVNHLMQTYYPSYGSAVLNLQVSPEQTIALEQAVPCGLILNELVTNSLKYAFVERSGYLYVGLTSTDETHLRLTIGNDSDTLPSDFDLMGDRNSMGLQLVLELVSQLRGSINLERGENTLFHITFPKTR